MLHPDSGYRFEVVYRDDGREGRSGERGAVMAVMPSHYVRRVVRLRPKTAQAAFAAVAANGAVPGQTPERCVVVVPSGRLEFEPPGAAFDCGTKPWVFWRTRGTLRRRWSPLALPVELELVPWSSARVELGLRLDRRCNPGRRFLDAAHEALRTLGAAMEGQLEEWLGELDRSVGGSGRVNGPTSARRVVALRRSGARYLPTWVAKRA
jgi:hypothetical protein